MVLGGIRDVCSKFSVRIWGLLYICANPVLQTLPFGILAMAMPTVVTTLAFWQCGSRLTLKVGRYHSGLERYERAHRVVCFLAPSMQILVALRCSRAQVSFVFRDGAINQVCCLARSMQTSAALRFPEPNALCEWCSQCSVEIQSRRGNNWLLVII